MCTYDPMSPSSATPACRGLRGGMFQKAIFRSQGPHSGDPNPQAKIKSMGFKIESCS